MYFAIVASTTWRHPEFTCASHQAQLGFVVTFMSQVAVMGLCLVCPVLPLIEGFLRPMSWRLIGNKGILSLSEQGKVLEC